MPWPGNRNQLPDLLNAPDPKRHAADTDNSWCFAVIAGERRAKEGGWGLQPAPNARLVGEVLRAELPFQVRLFARDDADLKRARRRRREQPQPQRVP